MTEVRRPVSVTLLPSLVRRIDEIASALDMTRSAYIERQLRASLMEDEVGVKALLDPQVSGPLLKVMSNRQWLQAVAQAMSEEVNTDQMALFANRLQNAAADVEAAEALGKSKKAKKAKKAAKKRPKVKRKR